MIVDEAYGDFMNDNSSAINLDYDNLIVVRSLSKGFGLAGLRVGYAVVKGRPLKEAYSKIATPFPITSVSEVAAIAALRRRDFIERSRAFIAEVEREVVDLLEGKDS